MLDPKLQEWVKEFEKASQEADSDAVLTFLTLYKEVAGGLVKFPPSDDNDVHIALMDNFRNVAREFITLQENNGVDPDDTYKFEEPQFCKVSKDTGGNRVLEWVDFLKRAAEKVRSWGRGLYDKGTILKTSLPIFDRVAESFDLTAKRLEEIEKSE